MFLQVFLDGCFFAACLPPFPVFEGSLRFLFSRIFRCWKVLYGSCVNVFVRFSMATATMVMFHICFHWLSFLCQFVQVFLHFRVNFLRLAV